MNFERLRTLRNRALSSSWTWHFLLVGYVLTVLILLAPVLLAPIGGDDAYWVLEKAPQTGGSFWQAFWGEASQAFDFSGQARTTALAFAERTVLALFTIDMSTYFSIPPFVVWATVKIALVLASIGAVVLFLRQLTFRVRHGEVRHLGRSTVAFIALALPVTIALGSKSQDSSTINGWNYYPTLTYGSFTAYLLVAALVLRMSALLQRSYRAFVLPVVVLMAIMGLIINLSYELLAGTVPLAILVVVLQPRPVGPSWWMRSRAGLTVLAAFVVSWGVIFTLIRVRLSQMACHATDTCYPGTVIEIRSQTLWNNFRGALPGGNGAFVSQQAESAGRAYPGVDAVSITLALLAAGLMLALWASWSARRKSPAAHESAREDDRPGDDIRGLLVVLAVSLSIALGTTIISGITARATDLLDSSMLSFRTGVVTWSALALAIVTVVRMLMVSRRRFLGTAALGGLSLALVVGVALYFPRNVLSAQENRADRSVIFIDSLHREVSLGDTSRSGDDRRCVLLTDFLDGRDQVSSRISRSVIGAQQSFEFFHGRPFCADGVPDVVEKVESVSRG